MKNDSPLVRAAEHIAQGGCRRRASGPPLELGVILRVGEVPVVVGSVRDPGAIRQALERAISDGGVTDREAVLFRELLTQIEVRR